MKNRTRKSLTDALFETNYQSKVASELWLNIGGKEYRLVGKRIKLGRAVDNDIVLEHRSCSRYHAMIQISGGQIILEDLKSRNGVKVSGQKISRIELKENSEIQIGDLQGLFFQRGTSERASREITSTGVHGPDILHEAGQNNLGLLDKFNQMSKRTKMALLAFMPLLFFGFILVTSKSQSVAQSDEVSNRFEFSLSEEDIIDAALDRISFEECREEEDLGNFRKARACLMTLPLTRQVYNALERITRLQHEMSQKRFQEGERALQNKYYDLAIIKLQEVLLIAEDDSDLLPKIPKMIEEAKEGKRLL